MSQLIVEITRDKREVTARVIDMPEHMRGAGRLAVFGDYKVLSFDIPRIYSSALYIRGERRERDNFTPRYVFATAVRAAKWVTAITAAIKSLGGKVIAPPQPISVKLHIDGKKVTAETLNMPEAWRGHVEMPHPTESYYVGSVGFPQIYDNALYLPGYRVKADGPADHKFDSTKAADDWVAAIVEIVEDWLHGTVTVTREPEPECARPCRKCRYCHEIRNS